MSDSTKVLRLQLLANGYSPLPNRGKTTYLKEWPKVEITPERIGKWSRQTRWPDTGLRVENGLCVIDLDVNDPIADKILDAWEAEFPDLRQGLLRYGKGDKVALFVRTAETFSRIHTHRFTRPGENVDEHGTHCVEIFGGGSPRQFGAFGAHTRDDDTGEVVIAYEWPVEEGQGGASAYPARELSPVNVPLAELPEFDKATFFKLADIAEGILLAAGWEIVKKTTKGENEAHREYDLTDDMLFETSEGEDGISLDEIERRALAGAEGLRVSASFIEPGRLHSRTRCLVGVSGGRQLTIWDSATGVTHMRASLKAEAHEERQLDASLVAEKLRRLAEAESEKKARRRARLSAEDDYIAAAGKLLQTYAYCPSQQLDVVPLWAEHSTEGMALTKFRNSMTPWNGVEIGERGGEKPISPVSIWLASKDRQTVEGLRLRPDMPRPTYEEGGKTYVNFYKPQFHPAKGGYAGGGWRLIEQLLPDERERQYFIRWLAFKWLHPGVPGPAILMVARQFGTGRGTLGELLKFMFGARYVNEIAFDHFAGRTGQSQYTEWQADSLVVLVTESSTADAAGSQYRAKHDTYERLKEIVEPRARERLIVGKYVKAYRSLVAASYIIATNNPDALPLPPEDRRFAVLSNGEPQPVEFWDEINDWMQAPENIGAFVRELEAYDMGDYSPYAAPLKTDAKADMSDLSRSDLDRAFDEAVEALPGEVIVPEHVINAIRALRHTYNLVLPERWEDMVRKMVQKQLYKVGERDGPGNVIKIGNQKFRTYARSKVKARQWAADEARREALRNGDPTQGKSPADLFSKLKLVRDDLTPE